MPESPPQTSVLQERLTSPGLLLAMMGRAAMRRLKEAHAANGLSPRQFHLLAMLHDGGPLGQAELASVTESDPSILVTMLNPLEDAGLISRERDPEDRRRHVVTLTAAGAAHLTRAARAQREAEDLLFAGIDGEQREALKTLLMELQASLAERGPIGPIACAADPVADGCAADPALSPIVLPPDTGTGGHADA